MKDLKEKVQSLPCVLSLSQPCSVGGRVRQTRCLRVGAEHRWSRGASGASGTALVTSETKTTARRMTCCPSIRASPSSSQRIPSHWPRVFNPRLPRPQAVLVHITGSAFIAGISHRAAPHADAQPSHKSCSPGASSARSLDGGCCSWQASIDFCPRARNTAGRPSRGFPRRDMHPKAVHIPRCPPPPPPPGHHSGHEQGRTAGRAARAPRAAPKRRR